MNRHVQTTAILSTALLMLAISGAVADTRGPISATDATIDNRATGRPAVDSPPPPPVDGGGWDLNGPDPTGAAIDNRSVSQPRPVVTPKPPVATTRGGWDGNGPEVSGTALPLDFSSSILVVVPSVARE